MADYRYNFDRRDCNREGGLSYNQILDLVDVEGSGEVVGNGGVVVWNTTGTGFNLEDERLIGASIYLLFVDGMQYKAVDVLSVPAAKEFLFDPDTGMITVSISLSNTPVTIFYVSQGTLDLPGIEPVTLAEAKNFCKIDVDDDDALITALIPAARLMCEEYSNIGFLQRQVICTLNNGNGGSFLPLGPVDEIYSVKDLEGNDLTYKTGGVAFKQLLEPWHDYIQIIYTAGYPVLPENLKTAMLNAIMYLYDNRSQGVENIGPIATMLLKPVRRVW